MQAPNLIFLRLFITSLLFFSEPFSARSQNPAETEIAALIREANRNRSRHAPASRRVFLSVENHDERDGWRLNAKAEFTGYQRFGVEAKDEKILTPKNRP